MMTELENLLNLSNPYTIDNLSQKRDILNKISVIKSFII